MLKLIFSPYTIASAEISDLRISIERPFNEKETTVKISSGKGYFKLKMRVGDSVKIVREKRHREVILKSIGEETLHNNSFPCFDFEVKDWISEAHHENG